MDVLDWEPDRLKTKLKGNLAKQIDKKEMNRVLRSKDTIAGIRFLGRRLTFAINTGICLSQRETDREIETKTHYIAQGRLLDRAAMN